MVSAAREKENKVKSAEPAQAADIAPVSEREAETIDLNAERFHRGLWMVVEEEKRKVRSPAVASLRPNLLLQALRSLPFLHLANPLPRTD